jgi:hypothetical protein
MPARPALISRRALALLAAALTTLVAGCAPPGTPVASKQASELDVATSRISVACGYEEEITATGHPNPKELTWIGSIAVSGANKLAHVYARDQSNIYQGESVGAIVNDSISLLAGCRLRAARLVLEHALAHH